MFVRTVISALKEVSPDRKCFRMVGGVLVERQVKNVLPALEHNHIQVVNIACSYSHTILYQSYLNLGNVCVLLKSIKSTL